jgi:hypothetical protein
MVDEPEPAEPARQGGPAAKPGHAQRLEPAVQPPRVAQPAHTAPTGSAGQEVTTEPDAAALYRQALLSVSRLFEAAVMDNITPGRLMTAVSELEELAPLILDSTAAGRALLRTAMGTYAEGAGFVLPHSVNVAILAVEVGRHLGLERQRLLNLCLAGFVHDIGSVRLPRGLLAKSENLTPSEWETMRARPTYSYEALRSLGSRYAPIAEIANQVYERLDGSGYPEALQGDEILPEARILGAVDFFESFAHPRPYKGTFPGTANHGIQMLLQMADKFGQTTLRALVGSIGLFPIGSYVRLSSGEIGRVLDVKEENPMRPSVEVLLTSDRLPPRKPRTVDLLAMPQVYVSQALTASDLRELGLLPPPSQISLSVELENNRAQEASSPW